MTLSFRVRVCRLPRVSMWRVFEVARRSCCRQIWAVGPPGTSVQYWRLFRFWFRRGYGLSRKPFPQLKSNAYDLADHFRFLGVAHHSDRYGRKRMRLQHDLLALQTAPAAGVTIAGFHEVDGTVKF